MRKYFKNFIRRLRSNRDTLSRKCKSVNERINQPCTDWRLSSGMRREVTDRLRCYRVSCCRHSPCFNFLDIDGIFSICIPSHWKPIFHSNHFCAVIGDFPINVCDCRRVISFLACSRIDMSRHWRLVRHSFIMRWARDLLEIFLITLRIPRLITYQRLMFNSS